MTKSLTVVYTIHDETSFESERKRILDLSQQYDPDNPPAWGVSASSTSDEIRRIELIEEAHELDEIDLAATVIAMPVVNHDTQLPE
ncbi:MAG: hypothetical protein HRT95_00515 [Moritella sp.]|uniref:hypothetical protein n=1 Tax=Moritella sp. TaxID=78556 RepID=UPI001D3F9743|nr:hypothetical protein [Moritella sp.]NQZ48700.1 hypothetical protein [Moritella sp.]